MKNVYYGWKIVAVLFTTLVFSSGLGFYNQTLMLQALVSEKGLPVTVASSAVSVFFLCSGLVGLYVASSLERYEVRTIVTVGALLAAAAMVGISFVETAWQLIFSFAVFGVGFAASGLLPATTLVTRWFQKRRAVALSLASTGLSVGGVLITPGSALLIESQGIDTACWYFAALYIVGVIPLSLLYLRSYPADLGLKTDGESLAGEAPEVPSGTRYRDAVGQTYFWGLSIAFFFLMLAQVGGIAHQYGIINSYLDGRQAAIVLGIIPVTSIIGRLAGGFLIERFDMSLFAMVMMVLQAIALMLLGFAESLLSFIVALALFGITIGNLLMLQPLLIAATYGQLHYSRIFGLSNLLTAVGIAGGPLLMGMIFARFNDYGSAYLCASLAGVLGLGCFLTVRHLNRS